ncbi:hypothetical protein D1841_14070 [Neglecta sp. X4]|uniref:M56 family metallopeptidase n=1 Tax=unclassified Neglectibacter TaxID=2632164 RepID=UPI00136ECA9B|nr:MULTISPECIES: M56 family metallopeptidase [unclassified Neglectibacter]NBI18682.1 hypothetical protein [Neglectibacter sp. 59]NBJ74360.1 hypothetical protein [Neglectibacter sp. X4]NCE82124.1 hypothetical protein [Neglectibacter sp. X58]
MTVTIHSILNSVLWGLLLSIALSLLSRSKCSLCHMGTAPLIFLAGACLVRCCSPVEFAATQEVGTATLNHLHRFIGETAGTPLTEPWIYKIWAVGAAVWFVLWVPGYAYRFLSVQNLPISQDERIEAFCRQHHTLNLRVAVTSRVDTPCVMGFWQEIILLPDTAYTSKQLELILQHESSHIKHHDGLLDFLLRVLCTMFWWNPGIHICRAVITRLCDHRCDMEVLHAARPSARRYYCKTLLAFASNHPGSSGQLAASSLKSRFYLILYKESKGKRAWAGLVILIAAILWLFSYLVIFQPAYQPNSQDYTDYALSNGTITYCNDGSYILKTEQGEVHLTTEAAQVMIADGFRMENNYIMEVPYP